MVHQISHRNAIYLEVCSVSYQRHCASLLNKRSKISNTLCKKPVMADNTDRNPLPVVELRPFSKKVWRREKSLPDFYDKKQTDEANIQSNSVDPENDTPSSRLIRELTETRRNIETRQNTFDPGLAKLRSHPKAEFLHESNRAWRKQDLIPSFITRFERTKTSLESLSRNNTLQGMNLENPSMFENALKHEPNPMIKIKGGKMNTQIHRRHLLYLNPLETYRQPNSWGPHYNSTNNSRLTTTRDKLYLSSRHSFPLTSSRTRDLLLGDSQAQYPLKPIRREETESPHKFNNKLGAAKNSLEVLSKVGIQTRVEKTLEKEMELNLQKFRKDKVLVANDLKGIPFQCFNVDSSLTLGELSLKTAREANKPSKGKGRQNSVRKVNALGGEVRSNEAYNNSHSAETGSLRIPKASVVNPVLHPIGHPLKEETEHSLGSASTNLSTTHKLVGRGRDLNQLDTDIAKENNQSNSTIMQSNKQGVDSLENEGATKGTVSDNVSASSQGKEKINNNNSGVISKQGAHILDSSRIETNVAYLENLQLKSAHGFRPSNDATPALNLTEVSASAPAAPFNTLDDQTSPSQQSEYTSHHDQSLQPSQRVSPHSVVNSPLSQQNSQQQKLGHQSGQQEIIDNRQRNQPPTEIQHNQNVPEQTETQPTNEVPNEIPVQNESDLQQQQSSESTGAMQDTASPSLDSARTQSRDVLMQDTPRKQPVELDNTSPLTSSGFESQATTDQEDELPPGYDQQNTGNYKVVKEERLFNENADTNHVDNKDISTPQVAETVPDSEQTVTKDGGQTVMDSARQQNISGVTLVQNNGGDSDGCIGSGKEITEVKDKTASPLATQQKMAPQYSPETDEGIGLVPIEAAVLDTSVTEVCSDQGMTGCADNGDSGVSTTFMTSEDSMPEALEAIVMS